MSRLHDVGDPQERVRILNGLNHDGRPNLIYGLFRTEVLRRLGGMRDGLCSEVAIIEDAMMLGSVRIVDEFLLKKRGKTTAAAMQAIIAQNIQRMRRA